MAQIIITESKRDKMADLVEDMLMAGGRLMSCLEELEEEPRMNERRYRNGMGMRDGMGMRSGGHYSDRYGNRDYDEPWMGERRMRY